MTRDLLVVGVGFAIDQLPHLLSAFCLSRVAIVTRAVARLATVRTSSLAQVSRVSYTSSSTEMVILLVMSRLLPFLTNYNSLSPYRYAGSSLADLVNKNLCEQHTVML